MVGVTVFLATIGSRKEYITNAIIYTGIASGYDISNEDESMDHFAVNNAFDNLISTVTSRQTIEETALLLLAHDLMVDAPGKAVMSEDNYQELQELVPEDLRIQVLRPTMQGTFLELTRVKNATLKNPVVDILENTKCNYSIRKISDNLKATRKNTSDMLELVFASNDPAMAKNSLEIVIEVFIRRYKMVKSQETNNVVTWYENKLKGAMKTLEKAEQNVKDFSTEHRVVNFYEQTKYLAATHQETETEREKALQRIAGTKTELQMLEKQIGDKKDIYALNQDLNDSRKELSTLQFRITNGEVVNNRDANSPELRRRVVELEKEVTEKVNELHRFENNPTGVSRDNILNEWLQNDLENKSSTSQLGVIDDRLSNLDNYFDRFAPLGAQLNQLERQVLITEKEYLSYLHGLNVAKLKKQNISMENTLSTLDEPFYPLKAQPSKRMLTIVLSMLAAFVICFGTLVGMDLLDNSIRTTAAARKLTGREVVGALPDLRLLDKRVNKNSLLLLLFGQIHGSISLKFVKQSIQSKKPKYLTLCSLRANEGKKWFAYHFGRFLINRGYSVALFFPDLPSSREIFVIPFEIKMFYYKLDHNFIYQKSLFERINAPFDPNDYDFIITVLPNISEYQLPVNALGESDLIIPILDASRSWVPSDKNLNDLLSSVTQVDTPVILNNVTLDNLESSYGEIPKERGWLRTFVKNKLNKILS